MLLVVCGSCDSVYVKIKEDSKKNIRHVNDLTKGGQF